MALLQSNYVPWRGYFDIIDAVDEFVLYDDRKYTKNDWRNRNRIQTHAGPKWITITVGGKDKHRRRIDETEIADTGWNVRHWEQIRQQYRLSPFWPEFAATFEAEWAMTPEPLLSDVNERFLRAICRHLGIETSITRSTDYAVPDDLERTERIVAICTAATASTYLSGPAARAYLDRSAFHATGIAVAWMDYTGYREYPQQHGVPFAADVSIIDMLCNLGSTATIARIRSERQTQIEDHLEGNA